MDVLFILFDNANLYANFALSKKNLHFYCMSCDASIRMFGFCKFI